MPMWLAGNWDLHERDDCRKCFISLYTSLIIIAIIAHSCADLGQETGARTGGILL